MEGTAGADERALEQATEFSDAFKEAVKEEEAELSPAKDLEITDPAEESRLAAEEAAKAAEAQAAAEAAKQQPGETKEAYEHRWKTLQGTYQHDKSAWDEEKAQLLQQLEEAKKPKESEKETVEELTEEMKTALDEYDREFDTVSKMENVKRKKEMDALEKRIDAKTKSLEERLNAVDSRLEPVIKRTELDDEEAHFAAILEAHPDFEKHTEDGSILKWIDEGPKYLRAERKKIYEKGDFASAIELIDEFKHANNIQVPQNDNIVTITQKSDRKRALSTFQDRKRPVNSQQHVADKDDYEGAWREANRGG